MIRWANNLCVRLWKDDSGVVMLLTVVVFLTLFVISCSIYAVGESIRQRMELQNAADSAAYSAAVVQADAISRVAVINKAMSWTYAQMVRHERAYVVDEWIRLCMERWNLRENSGIGNHYGWWIGQGLGRKSVWAPQEQWEDLHGNLEWWFWPLFVDHYQGIGPSLRIQIDRDRSTIRAMNAAEKNILAGLDDRIREAVQNLVNDNAGGEGAQTLWALENGPAGDCFEPLRSEFDLLRLGGLVQSAADVPEYFGAGSRSDQWLRWDEAVAQGDWHGEGGIQRRYYHSPDPESTGLIAKWDWGYRDRGNLFTGTDVVLGDDPEIYVREYYETEPVQPWNLALPFFGRGGAIVVAVARPMLNPFASIFEADGIFRVFDPPSTGRRGDRYQWAVSAARAGYRDRGRTYPWGSDEGVYNSTVDAYVISQEPASDLQAAKANWQRAGWQGYSRGYEAGNLSITDWDAILLPLKRAWSPRQAAWQEGRPRPIAGTAPEAGRWQEESASAIFSTLWHQSQWYGLDGGARCLGLGNLPSESSAPPGMINAAAGPLRFEAVDGQVYH